MRKKKVILPISMMLVFFLVMVLYAHKKSDFSCICSSSANNPSVIGYNDAYREISVDSYRIKLKFYNSSGEEIESEIYSGDEFTRANGRRTQDHSITKIPANCEYYEAKMRVTLMDGTIYRNIKSKRRYKPFR